MIRVVQLSGKYYGKKIFSIEDDLENIEIFVNEGTPVILVDDISDLENLDIFEEIEMVE